MVPTNDILAMRRTRWLAAALGAAALLVSPNVATAMTFEVTTALAECQARQCVLATGEIEESSPADLKAFVHKQSVLPGAVVLLDSPGGATLAGVALGAQIRNLGLATRVEKIPSITKGVCASACAYAFLGGVERIVGDEGRLGVHQMASAPDGPSLSASDAQWAAALIAIHVDRMGADISFLTAALRTPPHRLHWFSSGELARTGVVTDQANRNGVRVATGSRDWRRDASRSLATRPADVSDQ